MIKNKKGSVMSIGFIILLAILIMFRIFIPEAILFENDLVTLIGTGDNGDVYNDAQMETLLPSEPTSSGENLGFLDTIKYISAFLLLLINAVALPVTLFLTVGFPTVINIIIGIPLTLIYALGIVMFARGAGD